MSGQAGCQAELVDLPAPSSLQVTRALRGILALMDRCRERKATMEWLVWAQARLETHPDEAKRVLLVIRDIREELRSPSCTCEPQVVDGKALRIVEHGGICPRFPR